MEGMERFEALSQEEFAARMRAVRAYLGWTLDEAGERLRMSRQVLSKRERGGARQSVADRFLIATIYCEESGLPESFFTEPDWNKII